MIDEDRWARLAFHLYDECTTVCDDLASSERAVVRIYSAIHHQLVVRRQQV